MTISVCMGTYNGEKYIREQLMSILQQTRRADEVILCDDNSSDRTVELIRQFIKEHHLEDRWKLFCNSENKGYPGNYYYSMSLCTMEVVFPADQDDIWNERKLERMCEILERSLKVKALCCKFGLIDAEGKSIHTFLRPSHNGGTGELRKVSIEDVFYKCEWPGMVLAYRNDWYRQWNGNAQWNSLTIPHDFLICARAAEESAFLQLDEELAHHRRHDRNTGGEEHRFRKLLSKRRKLTEIEDYLQILEGFERSRVLRTHRGRRALTEKQESMRNRYAALQSGRIAAVLSNAWKYRKSVRLATVLCDVAIVRGRKDLEK